MSSTKHSANSYLTGSKKYQEGLEVVRRKAKRRTYRKWLKSLRATLDKKRVRGEWKTFISFSSSLDHFKNDIDDLIDVAWATCRSQTKLSHPQFYCALLSKRLSWKPLRRWIDVTREDIEAEVLLIWWQAYVRFREDPEKYQRSLRRYLMQSVAWFLPNVLEINFRGTSVDLHTVSQEDGDGFVLDLAAVRDGSIDPPLSLLSPEERYILYLLSEYPGEYTKVAGMVQLSVSGFHLALDRILERLKEEYPDACTYATRSRSRRPPGSTTSD